MSKNSQSKVQLKPLGLALDLWEMAEKASKRECRRVSKQIEYWARMGKACVEDKDCYNLLMKKLEEKEQDK